jgi:hypothetical protein
MPYIFTLVFTLVAAIRVYSPHDRCQWQKTILVVVVTTSVVAIDLTLFSVLCCHFSFVISEIN